MTGQKKVYPLIPPNVERVGKLVLDAAFEVHTVLGPGLLESVYQVAMKHVLEQDGVLVETEVKLPIIFKGAKLESGLRLDMFVENTLL